MVLLEVSPQYIGWPILDVLPKIELRKNLRNGRICQRKTLVLTINDSLLLWNLLDNVWEKTVQAIRLNLVVALTNSSK